MPYIRLLSTLFFLISVWMVLDDGQGHYWFSERALWFNLALAFVVLLLSFQRDFFLDFVALFVVVFFLQRIALIYFDQNAIIYKKLSYSYDVVEQAIMFMVLSVIAINIGTLLARMIRKPAQRMAGSPVLESMFGGSMTLESLFRLYVAIEIPLLLLQYYLFFTSGVGAAGFEYDQLLGVIYRITILFDALFFLSFLVLLNTEPWVRYRKYAVLLIALLVIFGLLKTSKGIFLAMLMIYVICMHFSGREILSRYILIGVGVLIFTGLVYAPLIMILRGGIIDSFSEQGDIMNALQGLEGFEFVFLYENIVKFLSGRFSGIDWLVGLMTVGREAFPSHVSLWGEAARIIDSLFPGDLFGSNDWVRVDRLVPVLFGQFSSLESLHGHGENVGIAGFFYLMGGVAGGIALFFIWAFISSMVVHSRIHVVFKVLYFYYFVIVFFLAGNFTVTVARYYEGFLAIVFIYLIYRMKIGVIR